MVVVPQVNPLASTSSIEETPSRKDGVPRVLEDDLRAYGSILIQHAGVLLQMPQVVMASASVLFQRFWFVTSFKHFGIKDVAQSALYLATKLEEHRVRIRDIINVFDYLFKRVAHERVQHALSKARNAALQARVNSLTSAPDSEAKYFQYEPMDYFASEYYEAREDLVVGEMQILKRLGFNLTIAHPYGFLVNYLQVLGLTSHPTVTKCAWGFCNDALLTSLLAIHPQSTIASGAIYLAALLARPPVALPGSWWEAFDVASEETLWEICGGLFDFYESWDIHIDSRLFDIKKIPDSTGAINGIASDQDIWSKVAAKFLPVSKTELRSWLEEQIQQDDDA